jgi:hypothetical protein
VALVTVMLSVVPELVDLAVYAEGVAQLAGL